MSQYRCESCDRDLDDDTTPMAGDGVCEDCMDESAVALVKFIESYVALFNRFEAKS